ncbi:MAG: hypothetical protein IPO81_15295 [Kouleothrix sp.]|nr:hypothetical protein [Kouleothrix sp.]
MIHAQTTGSAPRPGRQRRADRVAAVGAAHLLRAHAAGILRLLILVLVGLLFTLVGLVALTGRVEIGVPIIGGVLFIGFSAAQFSR